MYELLCRSSQRPWAPQPEKLAEVPDRGDPKPLILQMQANRSHLTQDARVCFSVIALLFLVTAIGPALHGYWLVPAFSILAMAALTFGNRCSGPTGGCALVDWGVSGFRRSGSLQAWRGAFP